MEKNTGGVSLGIRFIDSGNGLEDYSAVESQSLIGIYDGDWSLEEDGTVNASMAFARRVGNIRSHGNLIEKLPCASELWLCIVQDCRWTNLENLPLSIFPRIKWISLFLVSMVMWILAASGGNIRKLPRI